MADKKRFQRNVVASHTCDVCGNTGPIVFLFSMEVAPRDYKYMQEVVAQHFDKDNLFTDLQRSNITLRMAACTNCFYAKIRQAIEAVGANMAKVYQLPQYEMTVDGDDPKISTACEIVSQGGGNDAS